MFWHFRELLRHYKFVSTFLYFDIAEKCRSMTKCFPDSFQGTWNTSTRKKTSWSSFMRSRCLRRCREMVGVIAFFVVSRCFLLPKLSLEAGLDLCAFRLTTVQWLNCPFKLANRRSFKWIYYVDLIIFFKVNIYLFFLTGWESQIQIGKKKQEELQERYINKFKELGVGRSCREHWFHLLHALECLEIHPKWMKDLK